MDAIHPTHFADRREAGLRLADALSHYHDVQPPPLVLALPRGGVPVAYEIARALQAPLDVLLVRRLGAPGLPELGLGALIEGRPPWRLLHPHVMEAVQPSDDYLEEETGRQLDEIERCRRHYRGDRPPMPVQGRSVILADDGVATGGTVRAALEVLAGAGVQRLVLALPVAPQELLDPLRSACDELVCLASPQPFESVSACYEDFGPVPDDTVMELLQAANAAVPAHPPLPRQAEEEPGPPDLEALDPDLDPATAVSPLARPPARGPQPVPALLQPWPLREPDEPPPGPTR